MFKVPMMDRWVVVVTGSTLVDELQRFPDDQASFHEAAMDVSTFEIISGGRQ